MSRSRTGSKGWGYEYWSRRPGNESFNGGVPGRWAKTHTHRLERRISDRGIRERIAEMESPCDLIIVSAFGYIDTANGWGLNWMGDDRLWFWAGG